MKKLLTFCLFLLLTQTTYSQKCIPPEMGFCDASASYCDPSSLANTNCNVLRWTALEAYWSFVGDGGTVTITIEPNICLPGSPPGDGIASQLLESCSPVTALPTPTHNPQVITYTTQPCKVYSLYVHKLGTCSCDQVGFTMVSVGGMGSPKIPTPLTFTLSGEACVCNTVELCPVILSPCDVFNQWEINGVPRPEFDGDECLDYEFTSTAPVTICLTATLGDPNNPAAICDQVKQCTTLTPVLRPDRNEPIEYICWEDHLGGGYQWYDQTLFSSCVNPPCTTLQRGPDGCCFSLIQPIVLRRRPTEPIKAVFICDKSELPYFAEDGRVIREAVCHEVISFQDDIHGCDTTYYLYLIEFDPTAEITRSCENPNEIILSAEAELEVDCPIGIINYTLQWVDCNNGTVVSTDTFLTITMPGDYCLEMIIEYTTQSGAVEVCIKQLGEFNITEDDFKEGSISAFGDAIVCIGRNGVYTVNDAGGITEYNWAITQGMGTILTPNPEDSSTIRVNWNLAPGDTGIICVEISEECVTGDTCIKVINIPELAPSAGADTSICGLVYLLDGESDSGVGEWTILSFAGNVIFDNVQDDKSMISVDAYGSYTFIWSENLEGCEGADTVTIIFNEVPFFSNPDTTCHDAEGYFFFDFEINGGSQPYTITTGNGSINNMDLYASDTLFGGTDYTITITDSAGCSFTIDINHNCDCGPVTSGTMVDTLIKACVDECVTITTNNDHQAEANGCVFVILTADTILNAADPYRDTIEVQIHDGINGNEFCFDPNVMTAGVEYYFLYLVTTCGPNGEPLLDNGCLRKTGSPIIFYDYPVVDLGSDIGVCGFDTILNVQSAVVGTGMWTMLSGPGNAIFNDQMPSSMLTVDQNGTYEFVWTESIEGCASSDTISITFWDAPIYDQILIECDSTKENYRITFVITGGDASSLVFDGGTVNIGNWQPTWTGSVYQSPWISTGDSIYLTISDQYDCLPDVLSLSHDCDCATSPGQIDVMPQAFCLEGTAQTMYNGGVQDLNDIVVFYLHDGDANTIGTVLAFNQTGDFSFILATMSRNTTYYITARVGNDNGMGGVDQQDPCIGETEGKSVIWYDDPVAGIAVANDTFFCLTDSIFIDGSGSVNRAGTGTLQYEWTGPKVVSANGDGIWTEETGVFTLIVTNSITGCSDTTDITLIKVDGPESLTLDAVDPKCFGESDGQVEVLSVTGGRGPYEYSIDGGAFSGDDSFDNLSPGQHNVTIRDADGCEVDTLISLITPQEIDVEAEDDQYIFEGDNIDLDSLIKSITGGRPSDFEISWIDENGDTIRVGQDITLLVGLTDPQNDFILLIKDKNGCIAQDLLRIFVNRRNSDVFVPNVVSPNGDGLNDKLLVYTNAKNISHISKFQIFDRWGEMVYQSAEPIYFNANGASEDGWDFYLNGELLNPAVFVYVIDLVYNTSGDESSQTLYGDVTLLSSAP